MRFFENGPSIPDDLLIARDEGRVVFFCGAGVSRARAGLSDFFGLAENVVRSLHVSPNHPAHKILNEARDIDKRTGTSGLIPADRIFGLLERDFPAGVIRSEVAKALQPPPGTDLSAHRILLDLATTPKGKVQLVTTNFDRLFEDCKAALRVSQPPRLPDPARPNEIDGIIHLHGRVNDDYSGADGDGFVLSVSEFGRAYLSDGWATRFFREIVERFVVVFIGYGADDPPVHYLLEALNKKAGQLDGVYAFQSGAAAKASGKWRHKGVEAIAYIEDDEHRALWETLEAWAERAKAPDEWYKSVIDFAGAGPETLQPHQRGQVAHIISTIEGARKFSESTPPPPAEWLCVFDPYRRYARPAYTDGSGEPGTFVDPFDLYGLDSDVVPKQIGPKDHSEKRDVPESAWDALTANRLDRQNLPDDSFSAIRGGLARTPPRLPSRLNQIGVWISKVAHQPTSLWWAAHQFALHPDIQRQIQWELKNSQDGASPAMRKAWRYLFEGWKEKIGVSDPGWWELKAAIEKDGWDSAAVRKYVALNRPYLKTKPNYFSNAPKPPEWKEDMRIEGLLRLGIEYPDPRNNITIPDEWIAIAVRELRKNLETVLQLEIELSGYELHNISPIIPENGPNDDAPDRARGLSRSVIRFSFLLSQLVQVDVSAAREELAAWPVNDDTIFTRLRIWACGIAELIPPEAFGPIITALTDNAFWDISHQRDFLLVLAKRWKGLPIDIRQAIEDRLLGGPQKRSDEEYTKFEERRAWVSLNRITWLANNGCKFTFDLAAETKRFQILAPNWKPEFAAKAAESNKGRSGWVKTETEHSSLLDEPLSSTLTKAKELSGRTEDFLVERKPFAGLSAKHPVRSFAALIHAAKRGEYPEWAWRTFLESKARQQDKSRFSALIAERILRFPIPAVAGIIRPASDWLLRVSKTLSSDYPSTFENMMSRIIDALRSDPAAGTSAIVRGNQEPNWTTEAINAPVGKIAEALFNDPRKNDLKLGKGFPARWLAYVNDLIGLSSDRRRHALVILAHNLNWFYLIDPDWTETNLLSILDGGSQDDRNAVWSGFFWGSQVPNQKLYLRMKCDFLTLAKEGIPTRPEYGEVLAAIILAGWNSPNEETGERCISNDEMRDALLHAGDEFRRRILWQAEQWLDAKTQGSGEKWSKSLPEFLRDVWPRQTSAMTPTISAQLCDLAFSNIEYFPTMVDIILPLLTTIDQDHIMFFDPQEEENKIIEQYPRQTLALLDAVLSNDVAGWPYGIAAILQKIGDVDDGLKRDGRLLELKRKWNSR